MISYQDGGPVYVHWSAMDINYGDGLVDQTDIDWIDDYLHNGGYRPSCGPAVCGDGYKDADEWCDDGNDDNTDDCLNDCTIAFCGDSFVKYDEQCDDGNGYYNDGCVACQIAYCGDGFVWSEGCAGGDTCEECDDGNNINGDGCRYDCMLEHVVHESRICGDCNNDTFFNHDDLGCLIDYAVYGGDGCDPLWVCDVNGDGGNDPDFGHVDGYDSLYLMNYFYHGGDLGQCLEPQPADPVCGDINGDGALTQSDFFQYDVYLDGGPALNYFWVHDVDGSGVVNEDDKIYLLAYFQGSVPTPTCGFNPADLVCGDCNRNEVPGEIGDIATILNYVESGTGLPPEEHQWVCDVNADETVDMDDLIVLANYYIDPDTDLDCTEGDTCLFRIGDWCLIYG
jgi:cysteine-rich repeat protein